MEFPPVKHLISATFDQLNYREPPQVAKAPPLAPQPVASIETMSSEGNASGSDSHRSQDSQVGTHLNAVA